MSHQSIQKGRTELVDGEGKSDEMVMVLGVQYCTVCGHSEELLCEKEEVAKQKCSVCGSKKLEGLGLQEMTVTKS
jgi:hypothetical protein